VYSSTGLRLKLKVSMAHSMNNCVFAQHSPTL
jgi:hypothetical protein